MHRSQKLAKALVVATSLVVGCGLRAHHGTTADAEEGDKESIAASSAALTNVTTAAGSIVPTQRSIGPRSPTIGALPGSFSVTADGQASYAVPIWTPDGVMGMDPSLALSYNSS